MRKQVTAAILIASLATPAAAQFSLGGGGKEDSPVEKQYQHKLKEQAEADKRYQEVVKQTGRGVTAGSADPWAGVRPLTPERPKR